MRFASSKDIELAVRRRRRTLGAGALVTALALSALGCGSSSQPQPPSAGTSTIDRSLPAAPGAIARRLTVIEADLRRAIEGWRTGVGGASRPPPRDLRRDAIFVKRAVDSLSEHRRLATATISRLPPTLAADVRNLDGALDDLHKLSSGWPAHQIRTGPPTPLGELRHAYRAAQRRFGVKWPVLAAVNFVESGFGRVRSHSVAGARGPMQFMPSSWRAYGLGGDVRDPSDAILAAANLLHSAGAPADYGRALYSYNPSRLYVDAVTRYARVIGRDPDGLYLLYSWPVG